MLFGVFVVVKGRGIEKNLEEAVNIINNGGDIVMYPEGSIVHDDKVQPFKLGAAALAKKTGVPVIPISMKMGKKGIRKDYIIKVGEPIRVDSSLTVKEISEIFYDKVRTLHGDK
jgi:1-acyl-sn-glycerol-3-phosphate acyltransferase